MKTEQISASERKKKKYRADRKMTVIGLIVLAVAVIVAVVIVLLAVFDHIGKNKSDAEKIVGAWVEENGDWRFTFRETTLLIEQKSDDGFERLGEGEYKVNEKSRELAMADPEKGALIYSYRLDGDTLKLIYQRADNSRQTWTFIREKN